MSQKNPENSPLTPSYGRNGFFVSWVPNRQNHSPTDEMAPSPPQNGHIPGPRSHGTPNRVGGHLAQNSPKGRENPFFGAFAPFLGPEQGCEIFLSLPDPLKPVNRELWPQQAEPSEVVVVQKLRNTNALPMSQKDPENPPVAPSYGQKTALGGYVVGYGYGYRYGYGYGGLNICTSPPAKI